MSEEALFLTSGGDVPAVKHWPRCRKPFPCLGLKISFLGSWSAELIIPLQICFLHCFDGVKHCGFSWFYCAFYNS